MFPQDMSQRRLMEAAKRARAARERERTAGGDHRPLTDKELLAAIAASEAERRSEHRERMRRYYRERRLLRKQQTQLVRETSRATQGPEDRTS